MERSLGGGPLIYKGPPGPPPESRWDSLPINTAPFPAEKLCCVSSFTLEISRRPKRKDNEVPQPSGPTTNVVDEAINEEMDDSLVRAATTASSLKAEQGSEITLVDETQGRYGDEENFDTGVLDGDEVLAEPEVTTKDVNLSVDEVTLAQALVALKSAKVQEKANKKDQISLDEELTFKLQAEEEEEERIAREKAQREEEANIVAWDNVQAMIDADYQMAQ
ncbi:hypothetical protein Tco_0552911 [Tanacetum coccineum]